MKNVSEVIVPSVTNLYNRCIETSLELASYMEKGRTHSYFQERGQALCRKLSTYHDAIDY